MKECTCAMCSTERHKKTSLLEIAKRISVFIVGRFGPMGRDYTEGILDHIRIKCEEARFADGRDVEEWVDIVILAIGGALRTGFSPEIITEAISSKMDIDEAGKAIKHIKDEPAP